MLVSDFDFRLPKALIAQQPLSDRAASRLLHLNRNAKSLEDRRFRELPDLLCPDDLVVFNNTRVFPARLFGRRGGAKAQPISRRNPASQDFLKGRIEVLLIRQISDHSDEWECLVHPGRKIGVGETLFFGDHDELHAEVIDRGKFGERRIKFQPVPAFFNLLEQIGHMPLPPYIDRADSEADRDRYQTIYAREPGSVAAPTAGLHFASETLAHLRRRGIETVQITLHVGSGTFQPVRVERVEEHQLHHETYVISEEAAARINYALSAGRRVVAIGTTTVRTLEDAAMGKQVRSGSREASVFIYPGFHFRVVGALLTNFHLPRSSLLMLVCAFGGKDLVLRAYEHAVAQEYRFYSYGDCMFVE